MHNTHSEHPMIWSVVWETYNRRLVNTLILLSTRYSDYYTMTCMDYNITVMSKYFLRWPLVQSQSDLAKLLRRSDVRSTTCGILTITMLLLSSMRYYQHKNLVNSFVYHTLKEEVNHLSVNTD